MDFSFAGSRMLRGLLVQDGFKVGRLHIATLMKRMGIEALTANRTPRNRHRDTRFVPICSGSCQSPAPIRAWGDGHPLYPLSRQICLANRLPGNGWRAGSSTLLPCWTGSPRPCPGAAVDHAGG